MPTINNGAELFRHLDLGGNVQLNDHGGLDTQSGIRHFFQSIGDAFRSLTEGGRLTISLRYTAIQNAMIQLVALDKFPNLAQQPLQQEGVPQLDNVQRDECKFQIHLCQALNAARAPFANRQIYRSMASQLVDSFAQQSLEHREPLSFERKCQIAEIVISKILHHYDIASRLQLDDNHVIEQNNSVKNLISEGFKASFLEQATKKRYDIEGGYHSSYFLDIERYSVESINGAPPRNQVIDPQSAAAKSSIKQEWKGFREQLDEILPDNPILRRFISMAASQAGLEGELAVDLISNKQHLLGAERPTQMDINTGGLVNEVEKHKVRISVDEHNILNMHIDVKDIYRTMSIGDIISPIDCGLPQDFSIHEVCVSYGTHSVDMRVDLNQDMTGKNIPDFTIDSVRIDYNVDK